MSRAYEMKIYAFYYFSKEKLSKLWPKMKILFPWQPIMHRINFIFVIHGGQYIIMYSFKKIWRMRFPGHYDAYGERLLSVE